MVKDFKTTLSLAVAQIDRNNTELRNQKVNMMKDALDMKDKAIARIEKLFKELTSKTELLYKTHTLKES